MDHSQPLYFWSEKWNAIEKICFSFQLICTSPIQIIEFQ